jgi:EAL domain-containing protein (putative c-di-GMP-specific phosphodiesterase class I)
MAPAGMELEITESLAMQDYQTQHRRPASPSAPWAISIAIDDFGTGFSSLSYLSKLPVDTLKIDRSFVNDMAAGRSGPTLVSVIINLAHALKLKVVAEGVETQEQMRQLKSLDCDEAQGFLCGRPVPGDVFESTYLNLARSRPNRTPA